MDGYAFATISVAEALYLIAILKVNWYERISFYFILFFIACKYASMDELHFYIYDRIELWVLNMKSSSEGNPWNQNNLITFRTFKRFFTRTFKFRKYSFELPENCSVWRVILFLRYKLLNDLFDAEQKGQLARQLLQKLQLMRNKVPKWAICCRLKLLFYFLAFEEKTKTHLFHLNHCL